MSFGRRQTDDAAVAFVRKRAAAPSLQPAAPAEDLSQRANAAGEVLSLLLAAYTHRDQLRASSAIGAGAALTGEFAQRSAGVRLFENGIAAGGAADDILYSGALEGRATAWMFLMHAAIEAGVASYELPKIEEIAARIAPRADGTLALSAPEQFQPLEWLLNVGPKFRHRIIAIADAHDLSLRDATISLAAATAQLILRARNDLPPLIGVTMAAEIMLSVARMAPLTEPVTA